MSNIGWVDFSSNDMARAREVLALMKQKGTLDELGIGSVRDAYSDSIFPGLSTIQTSARYFLAVPKILLDWRSLSAAKRRRRPLADYLRDEENALAKTLKANCIAIGQGLEGIIGHTQTENGGVERRPSSTYWNGLRIFGIVRTGASLSDFCREWSTDRFQRGVLEGDEGFDDDDEFFESRIAKIPESKGVWREGLTLDLSKLEARFLSDRFQAADQHSLGAQLLKSRLVEDAIHLDSFGQLAEWAANQTQLSEELRGRVASAQRFSDAVEGAHIVFNHLLAQKINNQEAVAHCHAEFYSWRERVTAGRIFGARAHDEWMNAALGTRVNVSQNTKDFLTDWNEAVLAQDGMDRLEQLVFRQASRNKPGRSLLIRLPQTPSDWYGMRKLEFRWGTCKTMLGEIARGLKC